MVYELPKLDYEYDSLEPYIDAKTMEIHYTKHHKAYIDKLNSIIERNSELSNKDVVELLTNLISIPEEIRQGVINSGGGHYNHKLFWMLLKKNVEFGKEIKEAIIRDFGSFDEFKGRFTESSLKMFGSGWTWVVVDSDKKLKIMNTKNQNSPISLGLIPILAIDLWEHAYYLKYQNKRAEYIESFFNVINWDKVNDLYRDCYV